MHLFPWAGMRDFSQGNWISTRYSFHYILIERCLFFVKKKKGTNFAWLQNTHVREKTWKSSNSSFFSVVVVFSKKSWPNLCSNINTLKNKNEKKKKRKVLIVGGEIIFWSDTKSNLAIYFGHVSFLSDTHSSQQEKQKLNYSSGFWPQTMWLALKQKLALGCGRRIFLWAGMGTY